MQKTTAQNTAAQNTTTQNTATLLKRAGLLATAGQSENDFTAAAA